jgi:hypothetical protein
MHRPSIFLDVNVFKFSATQLPRYEPRHQKIQWGPREFEVVVHDEVLLNPNDSITNPDLRREADLLPTVANLGKNEEVTFVIHHEALQELWGIPNLDTLTGSFYGASLTFIEAPVCYRRVSGGLGIDSRAEQYRFLASLRERRFVQLQRVTGAFQGEHPPNRNQLLDAFHLWCAEHHGAKYFLTLDFALIDAVRRSKTVVECQPVRPSELLAQLRSSHEPSPSDT